MADLSIEGAEVTGWKLIKAKHDESGREVQPAKLGLVFEVPLHKAAQHLSRIARAFRNSDRHTLTLTPEVEQMEIADRQ